MSTSATAASDTTDAAASAAAAASSGEAPVTDPLSVDQALAGGAGVAQDGAAATEADAAPLAADLQDLGQKVGF